MRRKSETDERPTVRDLAPIRLEHSSISVSLKRTRQLERLRLELYRMHFLGDLRYKRVTRLIWAVEGRLARKTLF